MIDLARTPTFRLDGKRSVESVTGSTLPPSPPPAKRWGGVGGGG